MLWLSMRLLLSYRHWACGMRRQCFRPLVSWPLQCLCYYTCIFQPHLAPKPRSEDVPPKSKIYWDLIVSFCTFDRTYRNGFGFNSWRAGNTSRGSSNGCAWYLLLAILYRSLNSGNKVKESVFLTAKATAMVCWLFIGSWTFASVFSYLGGHDVIEHWVIALNLEPSSFL